MTEHFKAPEKIQVREEEIANLSAEQFKLEEKMKAMLSEIKENVQGTNSDGKETGTQSNGVDWKEERNIQPQ